MNWERVRSPGDRSQSLADNAQWHSERSAARSIVRLGACASFGFGSGCRIYSLSQPPGTARVSGAGHAAGHIG